MIQSTPSAPATAVVSYTVEEGEVDIRQYAAPENRLPRNDLRLALFEPDIPQNTGALLRLAACLGAAVDLIEPLGFLMDDRRLRRAGLDYLDGLPVCRHESWAAFLDSRDPTSRLVLMTTRGTVALHRFAFAADDTILLGRETAGAPEMVHRAASARVAIPLRPPARSLNLALAGAIALAEALRQTGQFPEP
jgi:tRNA (cytidine/uridine-2'-O-)-methyltransferase